MVPDPDEWTILRDRRWSSSWTIWSMALSTSSESGSPTRSRPGEGQTLTERAAETFAQLARSLRTRATPRKTWLTL